MSGKHEDHDDHSVNDGGQCVAFAMYKPHKGKEKELDAIVAKHMPVLRELELVTNRPSVLVRSKNGTLIEVFEWRSAAAVGQAHEHPKLAKVWEAMGKIADFPPLSSLDEANERFPGFAPV